MTDPIVYGTPASPFVRKVHVAMLEKGVAFESRDYAPIEKTEELLARHPLGKIPFLQTGQRFLPDSSVICAWLERLHPEPALYPQDADELARALWIEEYADTGVADAVGGVFFQRVVRPAFLGEETDETQVAQALAEDVPRVCAYLEGELGEGEALFGAGFGIGEIAVASQLANLTIAGAPVDAARYPRLAGFLARTLARPSFEKALAAAAPKAA